MAETRRNHVVIIDGTLSSLSPGCETHAGRLYRLLTEDGPRAGQVVTYHPGVQGVGWRRWLHAITGEGVNDAILAGYAALASRWRPGDRIFLFGYSRGAYAARSLAGLIDRVGLVRAEFSLDRRIQRAFRYYEGARITARAVAFRRRHCWPDTPIEAVCAWDTVRALGLPFPVLSRLGARAVDFHDDRLGPHIRAGFHALALDETRDAFRPVLWRRADDWDGVLEQMWFPGAHGDIGGDVGGRREMLPLANLSMNWMLERAESRGLRLPPGWRRRFPTDPCAPMLGCRRGLAAAFLLRRRRVVGAERGERLHPQVLARVFGAPGYRPAGRVPATGAALSPARAAAAMVPPLSARAGAPRPS